MKLQIAGILSCLWLAACSAEYSLTSSGTSAQLEGSSLAFSLTLYPIIQENCALCHESIQAPFFAFQSDVLLAHDNTLDAHLVNFIDPSSSDLVRKVRDGHNCWTTDCESDSEDLEVAIAEWGDLRGDTSVGVTYQSGAVTVPAGLGMTNVTMTLPLGGIADGVPADATMEISIRQFNATHYQISAPKIKTSQAFQVTGLSVIINSLNPDPLSSFSLIDLWIQALGTPPGSAYHTIPGTTPVLIQQGYGLDNGGPGVDQIQIQFNSIGSLLTVSEQRFEAFKSVVKTNCAGTGCHSSPRSFTFNYLGNSEVRTLPAFAAFTTESQYLTTFQVGTFPLVGGSPRYLVVPGDATNSAIWRAVMDNASGNAFVDLGNAMPNGVNATSRIIMGNTIQTWINGLDD